MKARHFIHSFIHVCSMLQYIAQCSEPVQRRVVLMKIFLFKKKEIILVSLCKTMQTHFALNERDRKHRHIPSCWWHFRTFTIWQSQTKAQATSWSIHRYDCFSSVAAEAASSSSLSFLVELRMKADFVFVPSRQYFISMYYFVWHSLRFLFSGLSLSLTHSLNRLTITNNNARTQKKENATTTMNDNEKI